MSQIYTNLSKIRKETVIGGTLSKNFQAVEAETKFVEDFLNENDIDRAKNTINQLVEKFSRLKSTIEESLPSVYFEFTCSILSVYKR